MNPSNPPTETALSRLPHQRRSFEFIRDIILEDLKTNKYNGLVQTRFPPEPNGYLHIGHAKATVWISAWPTSLAAKPICV